MADKSDVLATARKRFTRCEEAESDNRENGDADVRFARHNEQWPADIKKAREDAGKPCLTIPRMQAFIRQVVNDARMHKPDITVSASDDRADIETAKVLKGLVKNIEVTSRADIATDTAVDSAVTNGFGYMVVNTYYAHDDMFDQDICIERVPDPFSVYGDPDSTSADGSDWNVAFQVTILTKDEFEAQYGTKSKVSWTADAWTDIGAPWRDGDNVMVAVYWTREQIDRVIVQLSDGTVEPLEDLEKVDEELGLPRGEILAAMGIVEKKRRTTKSYKVTRRVLSGAEVLEEQPWPGKYIPIVPVYGEEYFLEGKRYLRSLVNPAKDAATAYNVMRSIAVEVYGMTPRVPWIGPVGSFASDKNWSQANSTSIPYLEYDPIPGMPAPSRQPLDTGPAVGAMQEAMRASDDLKDIMGVHDASLGIRSNETSGVAINARRAEGDTSTFHFIDNLTRAVRQLGYIVIDLIPHIYNSERIVRVIGDDGKEKPVQINKQFPKVGDDGQPMMKPALDQMGQPQTGPDGQPLMEPIMAIHDLRVGKYDIVVSSGPNFATRRQEASAMMTEFVRAYPQIAPLIMDLVARFQDWPEADVLAERLEAMLPPQLQKGGAGIPPQVQQQIEGMKKALDEAGQKINELEGSQATDLASIRSKENISREEIASKERIAAEQRASDQRMQMAESGVVPMPGADGQVQLQSAAVAAVTQSSTQLAELIMQEGQFNRAALANLTEMMARPNEIVRDPRTGRAVGSRKAQPEMVN